MADNSCGHNDRLMFMLGLVVLIASSITRRDMACRSYFLRMDMADVIKTFWKEIVFKMLFILN